MIYWHWLLLASLTFAILERLRPARPRQPGLRPQLANDLFYLAFNGHFYALLSGGSSAALALWAREQLGGLLTFSGPQEHLASLAPATQFVIYLLVADFMQWCVHVLLHRVPWLWSFHKLHHSIHQMDWAGNFRFHWVELIVYRTLLYLPLAVLGGAGAPLFWAAVFATFWGHFNHANIDFGIGRLGYVFNSPRMHLWHHDASTEGGVAKNFGIVFSFWDWIFGTAYWPRERAPERLGFSQDDCMPNDLPRQLVFPLLPERSR